MINYLAQTQYDLGPIGGGDVALDSSDPTTTLANLLSTVIGLLTVIAIIYFVFMLLTGAIGIISSQGDKGAYEDARKKITTAIIGLVVVFSAMFIIGLVGILLDLPYILNLGELIGLISMPQPDQPL